MTDKIMSDGGRKERARYIGALFILAILTGCSANYHLRQAKRHELIAISKGGKVQVDTFYKVVKLRIKESVKDTLFVAKPGDTIRIYKDRLKVKYVRLHGDTVFIEGRCDSDTIRVEVPVTITKVVSAEKSWMSNWVLFLLIGFAVGVIIVFFIRR